MTPFAFARVSGAPTPSEPGGPLRDYLGLRDSLRSVSRGNGGSEVCGLLSDVLDEAVRELVRPVAEGVAIVAVGGYGRRELSPHSDVDLMLLHDGGDRSGLAADLFRPLWDAKLRVGHSVRTLDEAASVARASLETQTTLLTGRLVTGDEELFAGLTAAISAVTRARPLRRHLLAEERARREDSPYLLMAADVKTGRGGLRTLHGFEWERRREELIGRFSTDSSHEEAMARESLLRVRNALHCVTGRSHDVYSPDLREPVAQWLGLDVFESAAELMDAMRTVDRLAERRWPEIVAPRPKGILARLSGSPAPLGATRPPTHDELIWILESGEQGRVAFERLWESGCLDALLPEWSVVRALPQLAPFHEHPVASHLWRTVDVMHELLGDDGHYGRIAAEIDDPGLLLVVAFLHDIGKGQGGDHAEAGAVTARSFGLRLGMSAERALLLEAAVRHHLLLPLTSTRRDLDDPAVIEEVASTVGGLRLLQVLYLLTVADSRATGPAMWGEWKAALVRTLFLRCAALFGAGQPAPGSTRNQVMAAIRPGWEDLATTHLDGMPDEYLRHVSVEDALWHLELILGLRGAANLDLRGGEPIDTIVVVGRPRIGLRRRVTEAFAGNGIDVLEARLATRSDGLSVDTFRVRDDRSGAHIEAKKWERLVSDVESSLKGELDTGAKVMARAEAYREGPADVPAVRGEVDEATGDLVLTIRCADRIGRLAEILAVLADCGLDIRLAKAEGRGDEVVDTFHVADGDPDPVQIEALEHRIRLALRP